MAEEHINVAVRLRPIDGDGRSCVELQEDRSVALHENNGTMCSSSYDAVFEAGASNQDVFQAVVGDMLNHALQGKNATCFAYGQTGSGKTHTIEGLMGHAADYIFASIAGTLDREFLLKLSAVEVYNEVVHDLLRPESGRRDLVEVRPGRVVIKNLREESLASASQLQRLLQSVREHRKVRETCHNVNSSRSHQIVTIMVESRGRTTEAATTPSSAGPGEVCSSPASATKYSQITFVDLAGSEPSLSHQHCTPTKQSAHPAGDREAKREGAKINQSLLTLGRVFQHLADKPANIKGASRHIPYRDSNLTRLLQPVLGGNSKTAIIATISPNRAALDNTKATLHFVAMHPKVNTVDDSQSRIRTLEQQVQKLRRELDAKARSVAPAPSAAAQFQEDAAAKADATASMEARLQAQLRENKELIQGRETLARKIAGLERLVLNADQAWRPGTAARSMDLDELHAAGLGTSTPPAPSPPRSSAGGNSANGEATAVSASTRRASAVTQSMPAFNRAELTKLRISSAAGVKPQRSKARLLALHGPPIGGDTSLASRPGTGAPRSRGSGVSGANPRAPGNMQLLDCLLAPDVRARISGLDERRAATPPVPEDNEDQDTDSIKAIQAPGYQYSSGYVPEEGDDDMVEMGSSVDSAGGNPAQRAAIEELKTEVRNARYAGAPGTENDQIRLARLELKLKTLQDAALESEDVNCQRQERAAEVIKDLKDEIARMKATEQRKNDAFTSLAHLLSTVKQVTEQIANADPGATTVQDIQAVVRDNALPDWVGQALTDNADSGARDTAAVAPAPADDGEVVNSRERPLTDSERAAAAEPPSPSPATRLPTPPAGGVCATASGAGTQDVSGAGSEERSADASTRSQGSWGMSDVADVGDDTKAVIVRAVNGMKAQEAARFKAHLRAMQREWRQAAEKHVAELEAVLQQYQEAAESLEGQKRWLMGRVLPLEVEVEEERQARDLAEDALDDAAADIKRLEAKVLELEAEKREAVPVRTLADLSVADPWSGLPTVGSLLPEILELWHTTHQPLLVRSQFLLAHQGKEAFFFMAERDHLAELSKDIVERPEVRKRAERTLQREREWLAAQLKAVFSEAEREQLFARWQITQIKERKKALSLKLWEPEVTAQDNGESSANVTLLLYGWDGEDRSLATLLYCLPHGRKDASAPRVTLTDKSARLVTRAASALTPRGSPSKSVAGAAGSVYSRDAASSRGGTTDASSFDDAASHTSRSSRASGGSFMAPTPRRSAHQNRLQ